jgi:mutator protein MutT
MMDRPGVGFGVILLSNGKILLGRRTEDRSKGTSELKGEGTWTLPGGKLNFGESFEEGAKREVLEETGIAAGKLEVISLTNDMIPGKHFVTVGLICKEFEGEPAVMEPEEITEWKWFPLQELPKPLFFPSEKLIKNYIDRKFYKH